MTGSKAKANGSLGHILRFRLNAIDRSINHSAYTRLLAHSVEMLLGLYGTDKAHLNHFDIMRSSNALWAIHSFYSSVAFR